MSKVKLIIIFNHKFEKNISKLEEYYTGRFPRLSILLPFFRGQHEHVIRVHESSWNFSGHVAQAAVAFIEEDITHYVFAADDLILNPSLNEDNILERLQLSADEGYIKCLTPTDTLRFVWPWAVDSAFSIKKFGRGFDYQQELPAVEAALERFTRMGFEFPTVMPKSFRQWIYPFTGLKPYHFFLNLVIFGQKSLYPTLAGYSDFFVVPGYAIREFAHYCGVFAAMRVFAEVAVPTALGLAVSQIKTELRRGDFFMADPHGFADPHGLRGLELWGDQISRFELEHNCYLKDMIESFPQQRLYVHPIKLSRWR